MPTNIPPAPPRNLDKLKTAETDPQKYLIPDGAGGLVWGVLPYLAGINNMKTLTLGSGIIEASGATFYNPAEAFGEKAFIDFGDGFCGLGEYIDDDIRLWAAVDVDISSGFGGVIRFGSVGDLRTASPSVPSMLVNTDDSTVIISNSGLETGNSALHIEGDDYVSSTVTLESTRAGVLGGGIEIWRSESGGQVQGGTNAFCLDIMTQTDTILGLSGSLEYQATENQTAFARAGKWIFRASKPGTIDTHKVLEIDGDGIDVDGTIFMANQAEPATPTSGGITYTNNGALYFKGSSGTVTKLADA